MDKCIKDFPVAQVVKNLPAMQETRVQSLGQENPLEKGMANHSSILAWRIPWTEEPDGLQSMGCKESDTTELLVHIYISGSSRGFLRKRKPELR